MTNEKNPNRPELPPEERREEREREPIKIEKEIPRPWEEMEREVEEALILKYSEEAKLSKESQEFISDVLMREAKQRQTDFARSWFNEHKDQLEDEGISLDDSDEKGKVTIAIEKGALRELKTKEEYREEYEKIENLGALKADFGKKYVPIESKFLMLNVLEKKVGRLYDDIENMKKKGRSAAEIAIKEKEQENLFQARRELAEKITGGGIEEEARKDVVAKIGSKEGYINSQLEGRTAEIKNTKAIGIFKSEWEKLSEEEKNAYEAQAKEFWGWQWGWFSEEEKLKNKILEFGNERVRIQTKNIGGIELDVKTVLALLDAGYKPAEFKEKGVFRKKIKIKEGEEIPTRDFREFIRKKREGFDSGVEEKAKKDLTDEWERDYQRSLKEGVERRISDLARSPDRAVAGIEGVYQKVKDRLIAEWAERDIKKEPKSREKLKTIEKEFEKGGKAPVEFLTEARSTQRELTGDPQKDKESLLGLLSNYGIEMPEEYLMEQITPESYGKIVTKEKRFLSWILQLIFDLFESGLEEAKKTGEKGRKPPKPRK